MTVELISGAYHQPDFLESNLTHPLYFFRKKHCPQKHKDYSIDMPLQFIIIAT